MKNNKIGYISLLLSATLFIGCGSSSSGPSKNSGAGNIDLASYFPTKNISKTFSTVEGNLTTFNSGSYAETIEVKTEKNITTITTMDDDGDVETVKIDDKNITRNSGDINFSSYRHVNIGDTFFKLKKEYSEDINKSGYSYATVLNSVDLECTIEEQLKKFTKGEHKYSGDLLKIKCINNGKVTVNVAPNLIALAPETFKDINGTHDNYNISYHYFKKDIGDIASIDDDCILVSTELKWQDDRQQQCIEKHHDYSYYLGN